jgi:hypothetical protein
MPVLDLAQWPKGLLTATSRLVNHAPDNLPELSRPRLLAGLVGLALAYTKASTCRAAATPYAAVGTFGVGKVGLAFGVAVDNSGSPAAGDLYVSSFSEGTGVYRFDPNGNVLSPPSPFDTQGGSARLSGAAVDPLNGDIYIVDARNEKIQELESSGSLLATEITVTGSKTCIFKCILGEGTLTQLATDSTGDVYFPNPPHHDVQEFSPSGSEVQSFAGSTVGAFGEPRGVAVDSEDNVYVADSSNGRVVRIEHGTRNQSVLDSEGAKSVAVDPSNNDVFVGEYNGNDSCAPEASPCFHVVEYGPSGAKLDDFGAGLIGAGGLPGPEGEAEPSSNTIAVNQNTHNVYATDGFHSEVWIFSQVAPPSATVQAASEVTASSATVNGKINPHENETSYHFEYVDESHYNPSATDPYSVPAGSPASVGGVVPVPDGSVGSGTKEVAVSRAISALEANTTYHFRVVATTSSGQAGDSPDETLRTLQAPPFVAASSVLASGVTQNDVRLNATINPQHLDTHYYFSYGRQPFEDASGCVPTVPYASAPATPVDMGEGTGPEAVELDLASANVVLHPGMGSRELQPNTVYHFQVVAENAAGTSCQPEATFITLPPDPTVSTGAPSGITQTTANVEGTVTPGSTGPNSDTTWYCQYGADTSYSGGRVPAPAGDAGMGTSAIAVSTAVNGLAANSTYHYRLVASNANADPAADPAAAPQIVRGSDHTFTTPPSEPLLDQPSGLTETGVTLQGAVNPDGHDVRYSFQYGTTTAYGQSTPPTDAGEGGGLTSASASLTALAAGVTYHYRLVATGGGGSSYSEDSTFTLYAPVSEQSANPFSPGQSTNAPSATFPLLAAPTFPSVPKETAPTVKPLTRAQKLAKAIRACKKDKEKQKKQKCEREARKKYGTKAKKKK